MNLREPLRKIDEFLSVDKSDFGSFYNWFQDFYFGDKNEDVRKSFEPDEIALMQEIDDLLAYAGPNLTQEERNDGIIDELQFRKQLSSLKEENFQIWKRYAIE
jgi:hypothetical protein